MKTDPDPVVIVNRELTQDDANWLRAQLERRWPDESWQVVHGRGFMVQPQQRQAVGPTEYKVDEDTDATPVPVWAS